MKQLFSEGDIAKSIIKSKRITQEQLARMMSYGNSRLNILLSAPTLDEDFKQKFIEVLKLTEDPFKGAGQSTESQENAPWVEKLIEEMQRIARQQETLIYQQTQILKLLQQHPG